MEKIIKNLPSFGILAAVLLLVGALIYSLIKAKKSGKSSCGGCSGCAFAGKCHGSCDISKDEQG